MLFRPSKLYKYGAAARLDVLQNLEIRFTQADDFNDPFEVAPYLEALVPDNRRDAFLGNYTAEAKAAYLVDLGRQVQALGHDAATLNLFFDIFNVTITDADYRDPARLGAKAFPVMQHLLPLITIGMQPTYAAGFQGEFGKRYGILSLSATVKNLLMWAHYGDCHRGLAIEFDASHAFFRGTDADPVLGKLQRVTYTRTRPAIVAYDPALSAERNARRLITQLLLTKSRDWSYEEEYRVIVALDSGDKHRVVSDRIHLFKVPAEAITGVVLGARASEATKEAARKVVERKKLRHVRIREAQMSMRYFALEITP